jgi:hypothetical protein
LDHKTVGAIRKDVCGEIPQKPTNQPVERDEDVEEVRIRTSDIDAEKRKVVRDFFVDYPALEHLSNREIARRCDVTEGFVRKIRKELQEECQQVTQELVKSEPVVVIDPEPSPEPDKESEPEPEQTPIEPNLEKPETDGDVVVGADHPLQIILGATADVAARMFAESVSALPAEPEDEELPFKGNDTEWVEVVDVHDPSTVTLVPSGSLPEYLTRLADENDEEQDDHSLASHDLSQKQRFDLIDEGIVDPDNETDGYELSQKQIFDAIDAGIISVEDEEDLPSPVSNVPASSSVNRDGVPVAVPHILSKNNEWYTPIKYIEAARELMGGIDVDPASCAQANETVQATTYYDIETNGLNKPWIGRVWLNPPYGREGGESNQEVWSVRLIEQHQSENTSEAILLVNAAVDTKWFQRLFDYPICFPNHRINFTTPETTTSGSTHGSALIYFGNRTQEFVRIFNRFGVVVQKYKDVANA